MNLRKQARKKQAEFDSHIRKEIREIIEKSEEISLEAYSRMRLNSYEQKAILPLLSDGAFVWHLENAVKNSSEFTRMSSTTLPRHYDDYLIRDGFFMLLERFKKRSREARSAESLARMYGIPKTRAKSADRAIHVLIMRLQKESSCLNVALQSERSKRITIEKHRDSLLMAHTGTIKLLIMLQSSFNLESPECMEIEKHLDLLSSVSEVK